jgi:hypothetical protein
MPSSPGSNQTETSAMHAAEAAAAEETPAERRVVSDREVASREPQPDVPGTEPPQPDVPGLEAQLAEIEDRYKRAFADLDNYRKRSHRDIDRHVAEEREATLRDWLEAVDSVERAMRMHPSEAVVETSWSSPGRTREGRGRAKAGARGGCRLSKRSTELTPGWPAGWHGKRRFLDPAQARVGHRPRIPLKHRGPAAAGRGP